MSLQVKTWVPLWVTSLAAIAMVAGVQTWSRWGPTIVINPTVSEPLGFYRMVTHTIPDYRRGMTVIFPVPAPFAPLVYGRGWLKSGVPLMKNIGAVAGDEVCVREDVIEINGTPMGPVARVDRMGAALPRLRGCFRVEEGMFLPLSRHHDRSFDGRYMGPQPLTEITAEARPLWTF